MYTVKSAVNALGVIVTLVLLYAFTTTRHEVPRVWNVQELIKSHLPPPDTTVDITFAPAEYYYALPEHVIYKTYPVYAREFEPKGYIDSLRKLKPEQVFDPSQIKTKQDWIRAGQIVFNWPVAYTLVTDSVSAVRAKDFEGSSARLTAQGVYAFNQYILNNDGKLLRGSLSCASCHTQITKNGNLIEGAQGNLFNNARFADAVRSGKVPFAAIADGTRRLYFTPWAPANHKMIADSPEEFASALMAAGAGVAHRQGGSYIYPLKVPSLFGIKDIRYLDHTGLMKHNSMADLMRYAALNQGMDMLTSYNGFIPGGKNENTTLPAVAEWSHPFGYAAKRYSDEQLYALAHYIYSLTPPENPNRASRELLTRGEFVFKKEGCITCHTPPLYTNNKLTPASGFEPRPGDVAQYDIFNVSVGTDSVSTLYTRRGTGYYKVPSLRNVWMQQAFLHNGNIATLEDLFNPARITRTSNRIKGHPFGLTLTDADKRALITFLKSL